MVGLFRKLAQSRVSQFLLASLTLLSPPVTLGEGGAEGEALADRAGQEVCYLFLYQGIGVFMIAFGTAQVLIALLTLFPWPVAPGGGALRAPAPGRGAGRRMYILFLV
jgi:hypothetical protein